jgi:hypothetical protein
MRDGSDSARRRTAGWRLLVARTCEDAAGGRHTPAIDFARERAASIERKATVPRASERRLREDLDATSKELEATYRLA